MFNVKNFTPAPVQKLSNVLNYILADLVGHGYKEYKGMRFVARGDSTAYLKAGHAGAVCVSLEEGDTLAVVYYHPSRAEREAWELSATEAGCLELAKDPDMEEDRFWVNSEHCPYVPPQEGFGVGDATGLYDLVIEVVKHFA